MNSSLFRRIHYSISREYYRWLSKFNDRQVASLNQSLRDRYISENRGKKSKKVYIDRLGYEWFYTSAINTSYSYELVDTPEEADLVIFLVIVREELNITNKDVLIVIREPKDYAPLYVNRLSKEFFENNRVTILSHLDSPEYFIHGAENFQSIKYIRSFFYPNFHHWATPEVLESIDKAPRKKLIFTLTSGLSGIPGNSLRKRFIGRLSKTNSRFDFYGRFSRDAFSLKNYRGLCSLKYQLLASYRYNLILENSPGEVGYITEKIFDALICGCMPIFHGTRKIFDMLPAKWFYYLPSLEDDEVEKLNQFLQTDAYLEVSNNRKEIAEYIDRNLGFYSMIEKYLAGESVQLLSFESEIT